MPLNLVELRREPDPVVVAALEKLLAEAKAGGVRSVAMAFTHQDKDGELSAKAWWRLGDDPKPGVRCQLLYAASGLLRRMLEDHLCARFVTKVKE